MFDVDWMGLLTREVLRERTAELIAEACAWAVGLSDRSDAPPGSFRDALNSVDVSGTVAADRFDTDVVHPFVHRICLLAADRARRDRPADWAELAEDVGEEATAPADVVRAGGWETPLRIDAEHLVLAALGGVALLEVEAEGLPLSLVRSAEALTRAAVVEEPVPATEDLAGSLFLAHAAVEATGAPLPVRPEAAESLLAELVAHGLAPEEVISVLPHLPVHPAAAEEVVAMLRATEIG